jgi:DNA-binding MarR family transcriptional regulator
MYAVEAVAPPYFTLPIEGRVKNVVFAMHTTRHSMAVEMRPAQALRLWHDVTLELVRDAQPDLSARQLAILLTVYLEAPPHTVRGLAAKLNVTKPVITRALDSLAKLKLTARRRDEFDRRNVIIQRTVDGALFVERLGDILVAHARDLPR